MRAVVIGSGIAGLACSIRLAIQGWEVTVLEANSVPGGKIARYSQGGFHFDKGPSLLSMPTLADELFVLAGKNPRDYFQYQQLAMSSRYFYEDNTLLSFYTDPEKLAQELATKLGVEAAIINNYLERSEQLFDLVHKAWLGKPRSKWTHYFSKDVFRFFAHLFQLPLVGSLHRNNTLQLEESKLIQVLDHFATYVGASPYSAPGMLQLFVHLAHSAGAFLLQEGMYGLVQSLVQLGQELGVQYHYGTQAKEVLLDTNQVQGVHTSTGTIRADVVVSNLDIVNTYRHLLPTLKAPPKIMTQARSSAVVVFYWGITQRFEQLAFQNIFLSKDSEKAYEAIFEHHQVPIDPTVQVDITAKEYCADAPAGQENWKVTLQVPAHQGQDWEKTVSHARGQVLDKLRRVLGKDIAPLICSEHIEDPRDMERNTMAYQGALYGARIDHNLSTLLRPANYTSTIPGLYFCGGTVHPGGGVPFCLYSAKLVAELVGPLHKTAYEKDSR